ncbi:nucleolin-like isoform X1 [Solanum tuberosum]|uniref:nucleolin-like isoform X1 n=2 Tax=Solanum tuberosum TaxID=4113 RepID=UPI0003D25A5B|nr:PREDICTED: nucleolin-like isoform X1 [Solanum tuberosum]XP_006338912.1 PREDICTED: nucleolin-like isoform X1 [Solanum tuberosum]XP_006338913.1 PREDICTED: nucleolin-like isoform X1 [Solanum tuberosum]XP_006338914.1 PREDICTED: nucleolin-like isoform X1 [Solanum tuberosum]
MPPKSARKTPTGSGSKRGGRTSRATPKSLEEPMEEESKDNAVELKQEFKVPEEKLEPEQPLNAKAVQNKMLSSDKKVDDVKESVDQYEKGERLDLEDNDPEYDPEEYGTVDYDERGIENDDIQEEGDEIEEEPEEVDVDEEEEGDMVEEDVEGVHEEIEGDEEDEHAGEEHAEMVHAAEEEEHHEVVKERRKRKEIEIFVGGLDKDATEDDLRKVFSKVGEVTEVRLMMNSYTKKNKGFAFLRFATVEQAKRACTELKNPVINGKQCGVSPSQDNDTLFLGNICKTWTKEALKEKLKHYGVDNIEDLTLVEDTNNEGMNRGFAFLEFSSRSEAMDAFKRLQKRDVMFGVDRPAKVSFEDSFIDPGDEIMSQVKTVFVDGLSASWDEDRVREFLKEYGKIEKVELARNMPSAKRKDFGFVTFDTHEAAVTCAKSINNEELGEGDNKVKVRARLSRPLERGRGKYGGRGDLRPWRMSMHGPRAPWGRIVPHSHAIRGTRVSTRMPPVVGRGFKRPAGSRDRRAVMDLPPRGRPTAPPSSRSYDRRPPVPSYPKSSLKREYGRREEIPPPKSRAVAEYPSRVHSDRRASYRDEYSSRGSGYPELPRGTHSAARRAYVDDGYGQRFERPPPSYREGRGREYDSASGSKRPYTAVDDVHPRYAEAGVRHSRARLDYELGSGSGSHYGDAYADSRLGRSNLGYGGSRGSLSGQDSHGMYSSRQDMGYGGGSYGGSDVGGMYSSSYGSDYMSRGSDVDSVYSSRGMGGSGYTGSGGSGSYY